MPLELDTRQRAMLLEMGVRAWMPGTEFALAGSGRAPDAVSATPTAPTAQAAASNSLRAGQGSASAQGGLAVRTAAVPGQSGALAAPNRAPASALVGSKPNAHTLSGSGTSTTASPLGTSTPALARGDGANDLSQIATMDWDALARTAADCQACGLCAGRSHSMLSAQAGRRARWMVVGDPPDEAQDAAGQAFTGEAGMLLSNMLKAVGATRGEVAPGLEAAYVTAVSKCRPPQGRVPHAAELARCSAYLQREIALVQPAVIVAMGRFANQVLLQEHPQDAALPLGRQRGNVYRYQGVPVVVTYTPQALIRLSADKAKAWADLCLAMALLQAPV